MCAGSIACISVAIVLSGCASRGDTDEVVEQTTIEDIKSTPMYAYTESIVYKNMKINAITPCTHMEIVDDELRIFPYFDYNEYISMKHIVLSGNDLISTVKRTKQDDDNFVQKSTDCFYYSSKGTTTGLCRITEDEALCVVTNKFPSSYVDLVLDELNKIQSKKEK